MKDKFWYSPYELKPKTHLNRQTSSGPKGFLIRWQSADFESGFADCLPWTMFGDEDINTQIVLWRQGRASALLQRSLYYAHLDGVARSLKQSLFNVEVKIKSHYTVTDLEDLTAERLDEVFQKGFTSLKLKLGRSPNEEAKLLMSKARYLEPFKLRLDFNGHGYEEFMERIKDHSLCSHIELVEDPSPYVQSRWSQLQSDFSVPIYLDQAASSREIDTPFSRVIKPARQTYELRDRDIITNSMDHPVGQSFAYWYAQQALKGQPQTLDFGLQTSHLFESNIFFQEIESHSCFFKPSEGSGVGFDSLFGNVTWMPL